jgi:hypothetical protein
MNSWPAIRKFTIIGETVVTWAPGKIVTWNLAAASARSLNQRNGVIWGVRSGSAAPL